MELTIFERVYIFVCVLMVLVSIRALFAMRSRLAGINAVYKYIDYLIFSNKPVNLNLYEEMLYPMQKTMTFFWRFDRMACVKPEYYDLLKPYFEVKNNNENSS